MAALLLGGGEWLPVDRVFARLCSEHLKLRAHRSKLCPQSCIARRPVPPLGGIRWVKLGVYSAGPCADVVSPGQMPKSSDQESYYFGAGAPEYQRGEAVVVVYVDPTAVPAKGMGWVCKEGYRGEKFHVVDEVCWVAQVMPCRRRSSRPPLSRLRH